LGLYDQVIKRTW